VPEVELQTAPPTILATSSRLAARVSPRHAAVAALSGEKQLDRQLSHSQMRVQYRRKLPVTQWDFNQRRQQSR
jgi:hypothetical protein